jgi:hypothetical protein
MAPRKTFIVTGGNTCRLRTTQVPGDYGRVFFRLTDGGRTASPDGVVREALMLRAELRPDSKV